ncbi:ectoine/hydroxyectoine ABC transporter permease subunit EhuD [Phytomonospora endophytica]|uniref:Polar amino acid transport system permease protein n=1 Tax=Phytomonospora endophytica TaxID=714109 RepID=A0A841FHS6_9ACTN|nr:ectoine/hydroxyectoine ABC transporter permease subunit EhuD [Phytomonospora endophytica]MBB6033132.1 polar amino acid transport system permease protein [Phytomonospora endophytica]GIG65358.1 ectoine/hydroxyectoine ABC transporter permease subunit EhuD [Phytomonospora endophytica]
MSWWNNQAALELFPLLLEGFRITLLATLLGSLLALTLGLVFAFIDRTAPEYIRRPLGWVLQFIRFTPPIAQLFFAYYVIRPNLGIGVDALTVGIVVLGVHYATYNAEIYRAGIEGVPKGQWEAVTALSLPQGRAWFGVILPQAIRRVLPSLGNNVIILFKEVPVLSAIAVTEMVRVGKEYTSDHFAFYIEAFTIAGLIYLVASYPTSLLMRKLEVRLGN